MNQQNGTTGANSSTVGNVLNTDPDEGSRANTESIIRGRAAEILAFIKAKDMESLAQAVHPDKGVRFSPYGYVNKEKDLVFTADKVRQLPSDNTVYVWGSYDGSGEPIRLSFADYYNKFVYDKDFLNAKEVGYNQVLGKGNSLINIADVYPEAKFVEYHFPGFDPQYNGMDWVSLRLAFEQKSSKWYLVGVIHDQWTI
ncbi:hypothetical protein [Sporotomaculum syntrophicum]|uniref:hypothetical protein n=1 Tax=Sporotomaculum syntrophicum TaxID=182264 RepID=UPI00137954D5|nr:hypothetical protein [Sporotomaculum syntrophicum]